MTNIISFVVLNFKYQLVFLVTTSIAWQLKFWKSQLILSLPSMYFTFLDLHIMLLNAVLTIDVFLSTTERHIYPSCSYIVSIIVTHVKPCKTHVNFTRPWKCSLSRKNKQIWTVESYCCIIDSYKPFFYGTYSESSLCDEIFGDGVLIRSGTSRWPSIHFH